ncbi:MAG: protein kinase domain-containing protein [Gemmatimonadaceae bacterium]
MDLRDRLDASLGGSYTIERELGGGGMARVFVAREIALNRAVVIKVLPPELAAEVSEERFRREINLAASLQHPHIVPILSAGQADGLLYYTMPLVEGETLRSRLSREGELPIVDAVRVLGCVADAVAYAHAHGIVHRDIKPENILLTGQYAVVTDFGVAKALGEAASETTLTGTGLAIGTAAYMAPEQVAAEPAIDHRADIYSFGIVAYEVLTGATPFSGRTSQQQAAAHLTQQPERVAMRRPAVPAALADLIMKCLEKRPADRPQSTEQLTRELSAIAVSGGQPSSERSPGRSRRTLLLGAAGVLLVAAIVAAFAVDRGRRDGVAVSGKRVVVAVLSNETGDTTLAPLGKMAADWITQGLQETGFIDVVDLRTVLHTSQALSGQSTPLVEALAAQTGAAIAVWGSYYIELDSLIVRAQIVSASDGKLLRTVSVGRVSRTTPTLALELLREQVLAALAPLVDPRLATWETSLKPPTYAAYRSYVEGLETYVAQIFGLTYDSSAAQFAEAVRFDSTFQTARLWQAFNLFLAGWTTDARHLRPADSVINVLQQHRAELNNSDRRFFDWFLALRRGDMRGTYVTAKEMMRSSPGSAHAVWESALAAVRTNRPREAVQLFDRPELTRRPEGALLFQGYWSWKGAALHLMGEYEKELQVARDGRKIASLARGLAFTEARAQAGLGNSAEALRVAGTFVDGSAPLGNSMPVMREIVQELAAHGQPEAARTLAERAVEAYRASQSSGGATIENRFNVASILYATGRIDEARAMIADLASADSSAFPIIASDVNVHGLLGVLSARAGDRPGAERISGNLEARHLDPVFRPLGTYWRARIAVVLGDRKGALTILRRAHSEGFIAVQAISGRFLHSDPDLRSLGSMPEFRELIEPKG